jgi:hypothetical protein
VAATSEELHYFDKLHTTRTVLDANERRRVGLRGLLSLDPWLFHYWFGRRSDAWYSNLFYEAQTKGLIAGEITPAYATLDEVVFRRIRAMTSEIKLIRRCDRQAAGRPSATRSRKVLWTLRPPLLLIERYSTQGLQHALLC